MFNFFYCFFDILLYIQNDGRIMKNVYRIAKLIQAYVSGKVSTEEREEVEHWITIGF